MKVAIFTRKMTNSRPLQSSGFTLIELLVVIGIIAIVAGLVVGLSAVAGEKSKISRAQVERDRLVTLIQSYKSKIGVYPPDHPQNPGRNTLLYELSGAIRNPPPGNPGYTSPFGSIQSNLLWSAFEARGIINASDDGTDIKRLLKEVKPDQVSALVPNTLSLVFPVQDSNGSPKSAWQYLVGTNAVHNPDSFDLWVDIKVRGQVRTIGNWRN